MLTWPAKDPSEVLDFTWTAALDSGDTIDTFTPTVSSGTVGIDSSDNPSGAILRVWLSGGSDGEIAYLSLLATTLAGRTFREAVVLPVIDRAAALLAAFRLRYPAFASIDDGSIGYWLADSTNYVGTHWAAATRDAGKCAWAAHKLVETGRLASAVPAGLTSFKSGTFSATVSDGIASLTGLESSVYGREFMTLRRGSLAGPRLAWTPPTSLV